GSLLAALWAYGPQDFAEFDDTTVGMLRRGLQSAIVSRALRPASLSRDAVATAATILSSIRDRHRPAAVRSANRTDALADVAFGTRTIQDVTHHGLDVVLTATDLRTS